MILYQWSVVSSAICVCVCVCMCVLCVCVCVRARVCVGSCLKINYQQISYTSLIGMHLMSFNYYLCVCVLCLDTRPFMYLCLCILALMYTGRDTYQEGLACYRLGNAYEGIGEHDTAIQVCIHVLAHGYKHGSMDFLLCAVS